MDSSKVEAICKMPRMYYLPAEQYNNNCYGLRDMMNEISKPDWSMVEIGSFGGVSAMLFAEYCAFVYCVDPYVAYSELDAEKIRYAEFQMSIIDAAIHNIIPIKLPSLKASTGLNDESMDMVYVDGSHNPVDVEADLRAWIPKIKNGGWICGHDINIDVRLAVEKVIGTNYKTYSDTSWAFQINR